MEWQRFLGVTMAVLFALTIFVGFQSGTAEARGFHQGFHSGFHGGGFRHHGFNGGRVFGGFRHGHGFHGGGFFLGVGPGIVGLPLAYSAYYPAYPSYGVSAYAPYPYYGSCYAYDAYGRCVSYGPPVGYSYPY